MESNPLENALAKSPKPFLPKEEMLALTPGQLADHLTTLSREGRLEEYLNEATNDPELTAQFSYWEKWLEKEERKLLDQVIAQKREIYREGEDKDNGLPLELEKRFTREELAIILTNTRAIQITFGCSRGCPFCAFDAVPGVREHIPYGQLENLFREYHEAFRKSQTLFYWASEPSDYLSKHGGEDKTYIDVYQLAERYAGYQPETRSRNFEDLSWMRTIMGELPPGSAAISAYGVEDEARLILPNLAGIRLIGEGRKHQKGIGASIREYPTEGRSGINSGTLVIITPRGLYNVVAIPNSEKYPQGQVITPIEDLKGEEIRPGDPIEKVLSHYAVGFRLVSFSFEESLKNYRETQRRLIVSNPEGKFIVIFNKDGIVEEFRRLDRENLTDNLIEFSEIQNTRVSSHFPTEDVGQVILDLIKEGKTLQPKYSYNQEEGIRHWSFVSPEFGDLVVEIFDDAKIMILCYPVQLEARRDAIKSIRENLKD